MKQYKEQEEINFQECTGDELLLYISWKKEYPQEAELAFATFCNKYQRDIFEKAEIYCKTWGFNETIAEVIAHCTFDKVWKYPSFDKDKSKCANVDMAILKWMYRIIYSQLILYKDKNTCANPTIEEDLSIATTIDEMIEIKIGQDVDVERKKALKEKLQVVESAMQGLCEKRKIIYLTYKAYEEEGKNLPRSVSKKLKEQLELTQNSIRVYKKDAIEHIGNYLRKYNGNK